VCFAFKFLSSTLLNLDFLPVKRQQRLHSLLRRRARNRFHFPNNWKINGDYPPPVGQCNSFLGGIHRETLRRGERRELQRGFWTAVAERSGDTAFRLRVELPKRRGASLPAAVQKDLPAHALA
jgi:hypothetical protein